MAARTIIDSIGVAVELEASDFFRGLDLADVAIERFRAQHGTERIPLGFDVDTSGLQGLDGFLDGIAQGAREELEALTRAGGPATAAIDKVAAGMARANTGALAWQAGLKRLSQEQDAARQRADLLANANQRLVAGMNQAGREAFTASAGTRAWQQGLATLRTQQQALDAGFTVTGKGADKLRAGFQALALQATGTSPAIANLVSGLLLLGPGSTAVLGVAAAAAVIGLAYNALTENARQAKEEAEKLTAELVKQGKIRLDPAAELRESLAKLDAQAARSTAELARLEAQQRRLGEIQLPSTPLGGEEALFESAAFADASARITQLKRELKDLADAQREARNQITEAVQASGFADIRDLSIQIAAFGQGEIAARKLAVAMDGSLDPATRKATLALLDQLDALQKNQRAAEQAAKNLELVFGRFGAPTALELPPLEIKPEVDTVELNAAVAEVIRAFDQGLLDDSIQKELERAADAAALLEIELAGVNLRLKDIGNANVKAPAERMQDLRDTILDVNQGLDALVGAAVNVGAIGEEAARAIGSVQDLADAIGNVAANASVGNILGLVGAGVNVLGTLFGSKPNETEQIQASNTRALERLTSAIENNFRGLGDLDAVGQLTASPEFQQLAAIARAGSQLGREDDFAGPFQDALRQAGLSLGDLERIAGDIAPGLELFDSKGRLVAGALDDLAIAIDAFVKDSLRIGEGFQDQVDALALQSRIEGKPQDADAAFERALAALRIPGLTNLDDRFAGVDTDDELRAALLKLLNDLRNGLDPSEVGGLTREDIDRLLNLGADALENFTDEVSKATQEMINIPLGFRRASLAFEAQTPAAGLQPFDGPLVNVRRGGDGASLPSVSLPDAQVRPTVVIERIEIVATNKTTRDLFDEIVDEAERRGIAGGITFTPQAG